MAGVVQHTSQGPARGSADPSLPRRANVPSIGLRRHGANAVTALRLILTPLFLWAVNQAYHGGPAWAAGLLFVVIAASDVLDGVVARRVGRATRCGRVFDHVADLAFILSSLLLFVEHGAVLWWVPAAVSASFAVYVADSWSRRGATGALDLRGSRIGHAGGIVNYVVIGILVGNDVCGFRLLAEPGMNWIFRVVLLLSAASISSRVLAWRGTRR
jgi:phosphatidylglycerophosphate synthase